jgi:hypothetical protein
MNTNLATLLSAIKPISVANGLSHTTVLLNMTDTAPELQSFGSTPFFNSTIFRQVADQQRKCDDWPASCQ